MSLPLFTDEAIYTRWSQIARYDSAWRFISLTDGKQPLFIWLTMTVMRFVQDPLFAGRLVSVGAGFVTMTGLFLLSRELFKSKIAALLTALLYVIFPFSIVYDRMALYDSLVAMFAVWSLYFEVLLVRHRRLDLALILGMILGGAVLTKSSAFFFIYLIPFSVLLFDFKGRKLPNRVGIWVVFALVSIIFAYFYYSLLRLSPYYHVIEEKNSIFVYPFSEWILHPYEYLQGNLKGLTDWLIGYFTIPTAILVIISFILQKRKFIREKILLFIWFLLPFIALALFGKTLYPRFILFMTMPLIVLAGFSLDVILKTFKLYRMKALVFFMLVAFMIRTDFYILTNIARAPIPYADLEQYINGWPSGGGLNEILSYLTKEAEGKKIYIATEGTFGSLPTYAVEIYLGDNMNVQKRGIWPITTQVPQDLVTRTKTTSVYFIFNQTQNPPPEWPVKFISKYQKGIGNGYMSLYQIVGEE